MNEIEIVCDALNEAIDRFDSALHTRFQGVSVEVAVNAEGISGALIYRKLKGERKLWWHGVGNEEPVALTAAPMLCRLVAVGAFLQLLSDLRAEQDCRVERLQAAVKDVNNLCDVLERS